jgi:hypothetical protein
MANAPFSLPLQDSSTFLSVRLFFSTSPLYLLSTGRLLGEGIQTAQTQADIIELNSHTSAQFVPPSHWDWKSTLTR